MQPRELQRLHLDVQDLIEQIKYHYTNDLGDSKNLTRHTHSLKSLALQTGNSYAAEMIHKIEGLLILNQKPDQDVDPESQAELMQLLTALPQAFIEPQDNFENALDTQGKDNSESIQLIYQDRAKQTIRTIDTKDLFFSFTPADWNLVLVKTAKRLSFYSLVFQFVDDVEEDLVALRLDQILQKYSQLGSIIFHKKVGIYYLLGLLTERLETFPQRVPQVHLIQSTQYSHQEILHLKVLLDHDLINPQQESSQWIQDIKEFISIESKRLGKQVDCNIFGKIDLSAHIIDTIKGVIFQAIRNSISHGILAPEKRNLIGKKNRGLIEITFFQTHDQYTITIEDDGEGFDLSQIRSGSSVSTKPMGSKIEDRSSLDATTLDELSGRNLGVEMMHWYVEKLLSGTFILQSSPGLGTKIQVLVSTHLSVHEGISIKIGNLGIFIPSKDLFSLIPSIQELRPSRLGQFWYGTVYSQNYPLWIVDQQNETKKFDLKTLAMYNPDNQNGVAVLFCYQGELGILIACDTIARERVVRKADNNTVYSQAFNMAVTFLSDT